VCVCACLRDLYACMSICHLCVYASVTFTRVGLFNSKNADKIIFRLFMFLCTLRNICRVSDIIDIINS